MEKVVCLQSIRATCTISLKKILNRIQQMGNGYIPRRELPNTPGDKND